jgi:surface antigen
MKLKMMALSAAMVLSLGGCADPYGPKQTVGGIGGAVAGGLVGSQVGSGSGRLVATGVGAALGGLLGSEIGRSLDNADRAALSQRTQYALETQQSGVQTQWRNPDSGNSGYITPYPAYQREGATCREFEQTISVRGRLETARGTACRRPDGTWEVVS